MRRKLVFALLLLTGVAQAQKLKKEDRQLMADLQQHIGFLASDSLQGRRTGTVGEQRAMAYISNQFKNAGLSPKGTSGFYQPFEINEGRHIGPGTHLLVDGSTLQLQKDYFPLAFSAPASLEALPSLALQEPGMPWFWDLRELLAENVQNPHFDMEAAIRTKVSEIRKKQATALFIYNSSETKDGLQFNGKDRSGAVELPVVYLTKAAVAKYFNDESATLDIKLKVAIEDKKRTGSNVVGYLDNGAAHTVVLGAHFDHLGQGEDGNALVRMPGTAVFNGADDNASGTAALIELARLLKAAGLRQHNYLFIAFSGEELGLFGSKYFVEHPTIDLSKVSYMINMDMIGRLKEKASVVTIGGYGTSPAWAAAFNQSGRNKIYTGPITFRFDSSGTGPSDHTSFYRKNIPVLFYFTGLHEDYHMPTDDADKINYTGGMHIVKHIFSLLQTLERTPQKMAFTPTREAQVTTTASFSVTLGIMPDYTFSGAGVRVDGVSEGRPAQKAGLHEGDVIVQLGNHKVTSIETYMQALSQFKKGEKTTVQFNRSNERKTAAIEF